MITKSLNFICQTDCSILSKLTRNTYLADDSGGWGRGVVFLLIISVFTLIFLFLHGYFCFYVHISVFTIIFLFSADGSGGWGRGGVFTADYFCFYVHISVFTFIYLSSADDSGGWGRGGVFTALSSRSSLPEDHYTLAGKMKGNFLFVLYLLKS